MKHKLCLMIETLVAQPGVIAKFLFGFFNKMPKLIVEVKMWNHEILLKEIRQKG